MLADIIERYEAGAVDGFIALPGGSEKSMQLFFEQLIPKLVEKGLFKRAITQALPCASIWLCGQIEWSLARQTAS